MANSEQSPQKNRIDSSPPRVIILMGVSGAGKTTIGKLLAAALDWEFVDADDFHPAENVAKMSRGEALTDKDREPWLDHLSTRISAWISEDQPVVLACSGLKRTYRQKLHIDDPDVCLVYLKGDPDLIKRRLNRRKDHYMPADLLESQFQALEEPTDALVVDIAQDPADQVRKILGYFRSTTR